MILKNIIPTSTWTAIRAYFNNLFVTTFNNGSAASGSSSVTLNAKSGILEFSASCNAGAYLDLVLTNSYIDANTPMWFTLYYDTADLGLPSILYVTKGNGTVVIRVYNSAISDATNGNIKIDFQIMN
jgi:hypothetical protein